MGAPMDVLEIRGVVKSFGGVRALQDVTFSVRQGEIRAIIGPNGAGKSTLFNVMTGLFPPDSGEVIFDGERVSGVPPYRIIRKGVGRSFQITNIFPRMTVFENVQVALFAHHRSSRNPVGLARRYPAVASEALGILGQVGLAEKYEQSASILSHGDQKRLEIAISLASRPKLLMLDEPSLGLSPALTDQIFELIATLRERGTTILLVEQNAERALEIVDRAYLLATGSLEFTGTPEEIKSRVDIASVYFGEDADPTCEVTV